MLSHNSYTAAVPVLRPKYRTRRRVSQNVKSTTKLNLPSAIGDDTAVMQILKFIDEIHVSRNDSVTSPKFSLGIRVYSI